MTAANSHYHYIEQPNEPGLASKMVQHGLDLTANYGQHIPHYPNYRLGPLEGSGCDTLGIEKAISILAHPYPFEACVGGEAHFEVTAFGTGRSYHWQYAEAGSETWADIEEGVHFSDTDTEYLLVYDVPASFGGRQFRCIVEGNISADTSRAAMLTLIGEVPMAAFDYTQDKDSVFFQNLTMGAQYVEWDFANGKTSTNENPSHLFLDDGTFPVTMVATNACGKDTAIQEVIIEPLYADFVADRTFGCAPLEVTFTDVSPYRVDNKQFKTFGGTPETHFLPSPTTTYLDTGTFDVQLYVYGPNPQSAFVYKEDYITVLSGTNPVPDIELSQSGGSLSLNAPFALADDYLWHFANGDSLNGQAVEYEIETPGIYEVQLSTTNHCGTAVGSIDVLVGEPEAAFSANQTVGCAPFAVQYEYLTEFVGAQWKWLFPGGQPVTSDEPDPVVEYPVPGLYDATLMVWADSLSDTLTLENYIEVLPDDCPLPGLTVTTDGASVSAWTNCPDGFGHTWLMGNGDELDTPFINYEYAEGGTYQITAIIEGICGADTLTAQVEVEGPSANKYEYGGNQVRLAPNPAGGFVMVLSEKEVPGEATFELFSPLGQLVLSEKEKHWGQQRRINLRGLPSGIYLYRFSSDGGGAQTGKLAVR